MSVPINFLSKQSHSHVEQAGESQQFNLEFEYQKKKAFYM